jgi:broad-specificity NMP kinase
MTEAADKANSVFWLGGSPCAGKSSISERLASDFGLDIYHVDEAFEIHRYSRSWVAEDRWKSNDSRKRCSSCRPLSVESYLNHTGDREGFVMVPTLVCSGFAPDKLRPRLT